ncbi:hypothetical protein G6F70_009258 [Rhizopus microsporus]|nr:hypothetical protein G6F71_008879 [Rhizopus microsporus]KAG1192002.1 hypothetical protein G6F70_009258 [Rhizopus microsporus]KAG1205807.1 hypothetical protein G6F69_009250 [Rhizopus microsporus]KAG1225555.1 hypothetical protein G6F67_009273 [Rhizopus microsporus]KAG1256449.1 hypothetical protein G6F68_009781 [Rhizopus microsporus]
MSNYGLTEAQVIELIQYYSEKVGRDRTIESILSDEIFEDLENSSIKELRTLQLEELKFVIERGGADDEEAKRLDQSDIPIAEIKKIEISSLISRPLTETNKPTIKKHSLTTPPIEDVGIDRVVHIDAAIGVTPIPEKKKSESLLEMGSPSEKIHQPANNPPRASSAQTIQPTNNKSCGSIVRQALYDPN